jgi:hypothetical protein
MNAKHPFLRHRIYSILMAGIVPALLLASCVLPGSSAAPAATAVPPTPTVQVALNTPTSIPPSATPILLVDTATAIPPTDTPVPPTEAPTAIPPTATFLPTDTLVPQTGNIIFAPWTTAATLKGTVQPGQIITYTAEAAIYQPMILLLESPGRTATLGVLDPNGSPMFNPAMKWSSWQWRLPQTGTYTIQVIGGATTVDYILTLKIAQLVAFPKNHTLVLHGNTYLGYVHSYAIGLTKGDSMTVSINTPASKAFLDVFGLATGPLLSYKDLGTYWSGLLPGTQEYVIEVIPRGGYLVSYTLTITSP